VFELPVETPRLSALSEADLRAEIRRRVRAYPIASDPAEIVARALDYPYTTPDSSYVLVGEQPVPLDQHPLVEEGRCPVLAYGSNGSPEALLRKFARDDAEAERLVLPVLVGELEDFDVVYSSHFSAYGPLPATLHHTPGVRVKACITLLTSEQVVRMVETEFHYSLRHLRGLRFASPDYSCSEVVAFVSRHGALGIGGSPVPLAAISASGRRPATSLSQRDALESARRWLGADEELDDFILANVRDAERSLARTEALKRERIEFDYEDAVILDR